MAGGKERPGWRDSPQAVRERAADPEFGTNMTSMADLAGGDWGPTRRELVDDHLVEVPLVTVLLKEGLPTIRYVFDVVDARFECREVAFIAAPGEPEIRAADFRAVPSIETIRKEVFAQWAKPSAIDLGDYQMRVMVDQEGAGWTAARRALDRSRGAVTPEMVQRVARVYLENPKSPTKAVAEEFNVSHRTAGNYVERARRQELLPPPKGRE